MIKVRIFALAGAVILCLACEKIDAQKKTAVDAHVAAFLASLAGEGENANKCGTVAVNHFRAHPEEMKVHGNNDQLSRFSSRPQLDQSYVSPGGDFRIHYTLDGFHSVIPTTTNAFGIPDFVYEAALAAEHSLQMLVSDFGFRSLGSDNNVDGPEYDIYFVELRNNYGVATIEGQSSEGVSSYIQIENDFNGPFYTKGIEAVQVTVAHELFHAVQFAYKSTFDDAYFFEMTSVWFEEAAYENVNDYLAYLPSLFRKTGFPLNKADGWHEYGSSLFLMYWLRTRDIASLRRMWESFENASALNAMETEIVNNGVGLADAIAEYFSWYLYTGDRARPETYFQDGPLFPEVSHREVFSAQNDTSIVDSTLGLSAWFYRVEVDGSKDFQASIQSRSSADYRMAMAGQIAPGELDDAVYRGLQSPGQVRAVANNGTFYIVAINGNKNARFDDQSFSLQLSQQDIDAGDEGITFVGPNPLSASRDSRVLIQYSMKTSARVTMTVMGENGHIHYQTELGKRPEGPNQATWNGLGSDGNTLASGIYIIILHSDMGFKKAEKIAVVR